ncbi:MAG: hypothetical protein Q8M31_08790 [Beijerinckiaceae bacterium]|nr:hypothetical protein [Beijerinckiaceae bacterium]
MTPSRRAHLESMWCVALAYLESLNHMLETETATIGYADAAKMAECTKDAMRQRAVRGTVPKVPGQPRIQRELFEAELRKQAIAQAMIEAVQDWPDAPCVTD